MWLPQRDMLAIATVDGFSLFSPRNGWSAPAAARKGVGREIYERNRIAIVGWAPWRVSSFFEVSWSQSAKTRLTLSLLFTQAKLHPTGATAAFTWAVSFSIAWGHSRTAAEVHDAARIRQADAVQQVAHRLRPLAAEFNSKAPVQYIAPQGMRLLLTFGSVFDVRSGSRSEVDELSRPTG